MPDKFIERRKHVRIPMVTVVQMQVNKNAMVPAMVVDLSAGGARIMSQFPLSHGDEVFLKIPLYEDNVVDVLGIIVWCKEMEAMKEYNFGVEFMGGVQFKQVNEEIKVFINKHLGK